MRIQRSRRLSLRSKVWLEAEGEPVFGEGRKRLLEAIERSGSIIRAASEVGISYRRAWSYLQSMESRLGVRLVVRQRGGVHGGGTKLTKDARMLIKEYEALVSKMGSLPDRSKKFIGRALCKNA